jgi:lipoyl(octanoyl) transferase
MESTTRFASLTQARMSRSPTQPYRLLVSAPADGATNMATDEALLRRARRTGETVYRVYAWSRATVSLGRNQSARGYYDLELARARGIDFVRRPTGGRAILHHREITYSVAAPDTAFGALRESYRTINRLLLEALRTLGVDARDTASSSRAPVPSLAPCFEAPVAGELVAGGRKLVGSAQVRDGNTFLQHGSILVDDDQHLLTELLNDRDPSPPAATLRALTGRVVTVAEFSEALGQALSAYHGSAPDPLELEESLLTDVQSLVRTRYAVADWTWRR